MKNEKTYELVLTALFTAIIVIMAFTPLGYIPLVVINATIIHIPVILGALFLGPKKGAFLGFVFGLTSFINNTFKAATASAFVFSPVLAYNVVGASGIFKSLYICFVPRILVGIVPYYVYILIRKALKSEQKVGRIVVDVLASFILFVSVRAFLIHYPGGAKCACVHDYRACCRYRAHGGAYGYRSEKGKYQYCPCICGVVGSVYEHALCHERYLFSVQGRLRPSRRRGRRGSTGCYHGSGYL